MHEIASNWEKDYCNPSICSSHFNFHSLIRFERSWMQLDFNKIQGNFSVVFCFDPHRVIWVIIFLVDVIIADLSLSSEPSRNLLGVYAKTSSRLLNRFDIFIQTIPHNPVSSWPPKYGKTFVFTLISHRVGEQISVLPYQQLAKKNLYFFRVYCRCSSSSVRCKMNTLFVVSVNRADWSPHGYYLWYTLARAKCQIFVLGSSKLSPDVSHNTTTPPSTQKYGNLGFGQFWIQQRKPSQQSAGSHAFSHTA